MRIEEHYGLLFDKDSQLGYYNSLCQSIRDNEQKPANPEQQVRQKN